MIELCDGEIIDLNISGATRSDILRWFFANNAQNICVRAYDEQKFLGYLFYHDVLFSKSENINELIWTKQIELDSKVFDECKKAFLQDTKSSFIPVYKMGEVVGFAHKSPMYVMEICSTLERASIEQKRELIHRICDAARLWIINGTNEVSYEILKLLQELEIDYVLEGDYWNYLGEESSVNAIIYPSYQIAELSSDLSLLKAKSILSPFFWEKERVDLIGSLFATINDIQLEKISVLVSNAKKRNVFAKKIYINPEIKRNNDFENALMTNTIRLDQYKENYGEHTKILYEKAFGEELIEMYFNGELVKDRNYFTMNNMAGFYLTDSIRKNRIFLIGPCIVAQIDMMTNDTIVSHIQDYYDRIHPGEYSVIAILIYRGGFSAYDDFFHLWDINSNDVLITFSDCIDEKDDDTLDLQEFFEQRGDELWFTDLPIHITALGSQNLANYLIKNIFSLIEKTKRTECVSYADSLLDDEYRKVSDYYKQYEDHIPKEGVIGAIVMNCNPFTLGHKYLVQYAAEQVDHLIVFVVEEDRSEISFHDRFNMAQRNIELEFSNVSVIPSGEMIISQKSFDSYFHKAELQESVIDASKDLRIFSLGIAPAFKITKRFVGEEPLDKVTNQYNQAMKERLNHYGIEVVEIPRLENELGVISASKVRKILKESSYWEEELKDYLPSATLEYLIQMKQG